MMMVVNYKWGHGSYGKRKFFVVDCASQETIKAIASQVVPTGIEKIESIEVCNG